MAKDMQSSAIEGYEKPISLFDKAVADLVLLCRKGPQASANLDDEIRKQCGRMVDDQIAKHKLAASEREKLDKQREQDRSTALKHATSTKLKFEVQMQEERFEKEFAKFRCAADGAMVLREKAFVGTVLHLVFSLWAKTVGRPALAVVPRDQGEDALKTMLKFKHRQVASQENSPPPNGTGQLATSFRARSAFASTGLGEDSAHCGLRTPPLKPRNLLVVAPPAVPQRAASRSCSPARRVDIVTFPESSSQVTTAATAPTERRHVFSGNVPRPPGQSAIVPSGTAGTLANSGSGPSIGQAVVKMGCPPGQRPSRGGASPPMSPAPPPPRILGGVLQKPAAALSYTPAPTGPSYLHSGRTSPGPPHPSQAACWQGQRTMPATAQQRMPSAPFVVQAAQPMAYASNVSRSASYTPMQMCMVRR